MVETLTALKGIGGAKAEALIDAGYNTVEKITAASVEDLTKVNGISESVAKSLLGQLGSVPKKAVKKTPAEKPKEEKDTKPVPKEPPVVKEESTPKKEKKETTQTIGKADPFPLELGLPSFFQVL